jgi:hypothetical protein
LSRSVAFRRRKQRGRIRGPDSAEGAPAVKLVPVFSLIVLAAGSQAAGPPLPMRAVGTAPADLAFVGLAAASCLVFRNGFDADGLPPTGAGDPVEYLTGGGYRIRVDRTTVTITDPIELNAATHWGDPHENINGKHIKDWGGEPEWDGARRSLLLDDGSKVTLVSHAWNDVILATSIYDGARNLQIDNCTNAVVHDSGDPQDTQQREQSQYDGETARFGTNLETGVATYTNLYDEDADFRVVESVYLLADTGGYANPAQVNDYYP